MSKMENLLFDDGFKEFAINGDESRVVKFHPADPNFIQRYHKAIEDINRAKGEIGEDIVLNEKGELKQADDMKLAAMILKQTDDIVRSSINYMLNSDAYDTVFGTQSPFCMVGGGKFLIETFTESVGMVIAKYTKADTKASKKRMNKYLKGYKK